MTDLNQALVLITGADGGFGRQMTRQFLAAGSRLIISDINEQRLSELQADSGAPPDQVLASIPADLSGEGGCRGERFDRSDPRSPRQA